MLFCSAGFVVDGVFSNGPADQVGLDIDHVLHSIDGHRVTRLDEVRAVVAGQCKPGKVSSMELSNEQGKRYKVALWVMTADSTYADAPFYFDPEKHRIRQSNRSKTVWEPSSITAKK